MPREHQKFLVQKFISFINVKDPFKESKELRTQLEATKLNYQAVIEASEKTMQELKEKIKRLEQQAQKEYQIDHQVLSQDKTRIKATSLWVDFNRYKSWSKNIRKYVNVRYKSKTKF